MILFSGIHTQKEWIDVDWYSWVMGLSHIGRKEVQLNPQRNPQLILRLAWGVDDLLHLSSPQNLGC